MYVCSCRAVTDRVINGEVARGASTIEELAASCGAGSRCGGCWPALEQLLRSESGADVGGESRQLADALR